ncbi:hypothetical protein ACFVAJ_16550 [Agromyces sp. NPDC057679]|uniref:hypothetical protein n=1 Tax=Agromyces sp. NPDC057679 TaxID=3346207 RepID=UPI0036700653
MGFSISFVSFFVSSIHWIHARFAACLRCGDQAETPDQKDPRTMPPTAKSRQSEVEAQQAKSFEREAEALRVRAAAERRIGERRLLPVIAPGLAITLIGTAVMMVGASWSIDGPAEPWRNPMVWLAVLGIIIAAFGLATVSKASNDRSEAPSRAGALDGRAELLTRQALEHRREAARLTVEERKYDALPKLADAVSTNLSKADRNLEENKLDAELWMIFASHGDEDTVSKLAKAHGWSSAVTRRLRALNASWRSATLKV